MQIAWLKKQDYGFHWCQEDSLFDINFDAEINTQVVTSIRLAAEPAH